MSVKWTKAEFFKCALQVNPAGYNKYRGKESLSEEVYNQQLLETCLEAGVQVVGIADHGAVDAVDRLRQLFNEHGIVVFPGFEICSSEKIHFVCLFDENRTVQELERYLSNLGYEDPDDCISPSKLSAVQIIEKVDDLDGFIFAAHSTHDNGVLKCRMNHVWKEKALLAAQIPGTVDDLKGVEDDFYRKAILNKLPDYRRERPIAIINAADVAQPEEIKTAGASCLIKMTRPCFCSFKQAFLDPESRVRLNADKPHSYASAIENIRFIGGYLDETDITFSDHLNAVIGGRGTGKSTLLEAIRFALGKQPFGDSAQKQHSAIIKSNLGNGALVQLKVRSAAMQGRAFTISRKFGGQPIVTDNEGNVSPYSPDDLLPGLELYGQNEIYEMTRDAQSRNHLVERFLEGDHNQFDVIINKALTRLGDSRLTILNALEQKAEAELEVARLPKLREQAEQFKQLGLDEKLKIVPLLEKEKQLSSRHQEELSRVQDALLTLKDSLPDLAYLSDAVINVLPHQSLLIQQRDVLQRVQEQTAILVQQLDEVVQRSSAELAPLQSELSGLIGAEEAQLEKAFKDIPASQGKSGRQIGADYQTLLRQIASIRPKATALENRQKQLDELYLQRKRLLLELIQARSQRSAALAKSVKRLNRKLDEKVRLNLQPEGDRQPLLHFLEQCNLEGVGPRRLAWVMEHDFTPENLVESIRCGELALHNAGWGITPTVAQALLRLSEKQLLELEALSLPDTMQIELNVMHDGGGVLWRHIDELSTGQQCTAVLHLLLLENQDPLILDQPEDNLDNAFIAERIVTELRKAKLSRQFLFATHNANIPVFGDAEWIGVLSVEEGKGRILPEQQGAIDLPEIQRLAANILEGGQSAFNQRREKYGFK
ncbi:TrlF family AAA-like ATPase [Klebsiella michiganensis]|uniref:TrlF family AAA-like ATPase n=1 Tax=Klebsiella michiganensis TaxID=1134687 RepID=UPI0034D25701